MATKTDIEALINHVNAKLNAGVPKKEHVQYVRRASSTMSPFKLRRRTGILGIDKVTGGGWPAGGVSQIAAPEGVGKNALVLQTCAECQAIYGSDCNIAWIPTEFPVDKPFAQQMGVIVPMSDREIALEDKARKRDGRPKLTPKQRQRMKRSLGNFLIVDEGSTAKRFEAAVDIVRSNLFQIVVVDSMGAILTAQREEKELGEFAQQSSEAFLVTEFQKKLWGAFNAPDRDEVNWTSMLVINQIRAKRDAMTFGRKWTVGGAHALKHAKLIDIWMTGGEPIKGKKVLEDEEFEDDDEIEDPKKQKGKKVKLGKKVNWEIMKAKAGSHEGPKGTIDYLYDSGFQVEKDLVDSAIDSSVILRTGKAKYVLVDDDGTIADEITGKQELYNRAHDDTWFQVVYDLVLKKERVSCIYRL